MDAGAAKGQGGAVITKLNLITVPVEDQDRALAFYTDKLGFTIITDRPMGPGLRWIELRIPKTPTHVALFTPAGEESRVGSFTGISFGAKDVMATYAELSAKGVRFEGPPEQEPWGTHASFFDSEGNRFVLSTAK